MPSRGRSSPSSGGPPSSRGGSKSPLPPASTRGGSGSVSPKGRARFDEALADAERMARRVEVVRETDLFAAGLLAHEYLARARTANMTPLEQSGHTDEWVTAFARLQAIADRAALLAEFEVEGKAYLAARATDVLLAAGRDVSSALASARTTARDARRRVLLLRGGATLATMAAPAAVALIGFIGPVGAGVGATSALAIAAALVVISFRYGRTVREATEEVQRRERLAAERAQFEASADGRSLLQRVQAKHPLLVKVTLTAAQSVSSLPVPKTTN